MEVKILEKQYFTVIGKLGQGLSKESSKWIPALWQEANSRFDEISNLAKRDSAGNIAGIWGAMSDIDEKFERWNDQGKYLAGCEVQDDSIAPEGWTKWIIPSYKYAVIKCTYNTYSDVFNYMIKEHLPKNGHTIAGAVHEFINPQDKNGELYLYFPIERI